MLKKIQASPSQNAVAVLFSVLFLILPLVYWPAIYESASLPRYFLIGLFTSISLLIWSISNRGDQIQTNSGFVLILCLFAWAALSTSWSPDPGTSLIDITQLLSMVMLAFLVMQLTSRSPQFLLLLIPAILAGAALTAMIGLGQYLGFNPLELRRNVNSIPATFINPNHAAVYFDFIPWLALVSLLVFQRRILRWLAAASLGLTLAFILVNTSRGSLLALFVSSLILLYALMYKPGLRQWFKSRLLARYREILLALLIPLITLVPLPRGQDVQAVEQWDTTILKGKADLTTRYRFAMYLNSIPAIIDNPVTGLGYGGVRVGFLPYSSSIKPIGFRTEDAVVRELHSDPLQYFVELGLPGGLLALAMFLIIIRSGWKTLSFSITTEKSQLAMGFWLALIAGATHAMVDFPLRLPTSAAMFWLYAGVLLGLGSTRQLQLAGNSFRIIRPLLSVVGIIGIVFSLIFYKAYLASNHDLYNALVNLKKGECVAAARAADNGLKTFTSDFMLLTAYAQVYSACSFPASQQLAAMNRVLSLDPTNLRAHLTRGDLHNQANRSNLAVPDFEKITIALPHRPYAYAGLGDSARLQGDMLKARHYYLAALKRKPDYKYAKTQLMKLELSPKE